MFDWPDALTVGGNMNDSTRLAFFVAFGVGLAAVLIDALNKYDQLDDRLAPLTVSRAIKPSMLASSLAYRQSFFVYILLRTLFFVALAVALPLVMVRIDPRVLETYHEIAVAAFTETRNLVTQPFWPAVWGLASAGVLDSVPFVKRLEPAFRRASLTLAFIPHAVRLIKRQISQAPFTPTGVFVGAEGVNRFLRSVRPEDHEMGPASLERRWARFASILYLLENSNRDGLRSRFIEEYETLFMDLEADFLGLETRVKLFRRAQCGELGDPKLLEEVRDSLNTLPGDLDRALDRAEFLLACAIPTAQTPGRRYSDKLRALGFAVKGNEFESFGNLFVSILVVAVGAFFGALLSHAISYGVSDVAGGAVVYPDPDEPPQPLTTRASMMLLYSTVILGALFLITFSAGRRVARIDVVEAHPAAFAEKPLLDYVIASLVATAVAVAVMVGLVLALTGGQAELAPLLIWAPRLLVLSLLAQILVYGPHLEPRTLFGHALRLSLIDMLVTFMTSAAFFQMIGKSEAVTIGSSIYLTVISLAITPALLFIYAQLAHRQRLVRQAMQGSSLSRAPDRPRVVAAA